MSAAPGEKTLNEINELIRLDTTSRDTNLPLIEKVIDKLQAVGWSTP
ncbi:hypothetical protein [Arthrobacter sp. JCM 19049]|nr:hypothetical protein [Arthrobacter sp. JCM 19049]